VTRKLVDFVTFRAFFYLTRVNPRVNPRRVLPSFQVNSAKSLNKPGFFLSGRPVLINRRVINPGLTREKSEGAGAKASKTSASFVFELFRSQQRYPREESTNPIPRRNSCDLPVSARGESTNQSPRRIGNSALIINGKVFRYTREERVRIRFHGVTRAICQYRREERELECNTRFGFWLW